MKALGHTMCLSTVLLICTLAYFFKPVAMLLGELSLLVYWMGRYHVEGIPVSKARNDFLYMSSFAGTDRSSMLYEKEITEAKDPDKFQRMMAQVEPEDDHVTAMCKTSMYTEMVTGMGSQDELGPALYGNLDTMDPVTTEERLAMYIDACREIYTGLDPAGAQRAILDRLAPKRVVNITTPYRLPLNFSGISEGLKQRYRDAFAKPDLSERWKTEEEIGRWGDLYVKHGYRPVREEIIPASGIADAVWNGKVAVFNATELLGPELFKLGIPEIADMHGDLAKSIPMYKQKGATAPGTSGYESLYDYAHRMRQWNKAGIIQYTEHQPWYPSNVTLEELAADIRARSVHGSPWLERLHKLSERWMGDGPAMAYYHARQMLLQCALNTRRLPKLPIPSIEDALGNPDWLERAWSMFWLGPIGDCWHYDDPDNLLIGVHGDIYVTVFEQQDREVMQASMDRGCWASPFNPLPKSFTQNEQLEKDPWVKKYPFITMKLEPGMGIVVPSGTFHSLTMPSGDRVLMNVFMMPKYKGLWDAPSAKHSFYRSKFQSEEYAAMRALKLSTLYRVWDTKKIGGWFEASKLEIL